MITRKANTRIHYLDSIRGIASLMVVVMHFIGWKWGETLQFKLAAFVFNGTEAVSFFFVLSGFVLSYSYVNTARKLKPFRYLYRRILRLYPAYIVNILLLHLYNRGGLKFDYTFPYKEMLMFQRTHDLYLPGWTLRIEIIYSVLILALIFLYRKQPYLLILPLIACYFIGPADTRLYMNHFLLGIGLAVLYPRVKHIAFRETKFYPWRWLVAAVLFFLFSLVHIAKFSTPIDNLFHTMWAIDIRWAHFSGLAAFFFLIIVMTSKKMQILLEGKVLLYLGKISYSIYLVHWGICIFVMDNWDMWGAWLGEGTLRFCIMFVLYISTTILAADLMYSFVEKPFIQLSKGKPKLSQAKQIKE